jgi:ankyrin repeat protein
MFYCLKQYTIFPFIDKYHHMPYNIVEAAQSNSVNQVKKFLERGDDANSMDDDDRTPLSVAVVNGNTRMIELLLSHGADAYKLVQGDSSMTSAIFYACVTGKEASVRALIEYGVDVNGKDPETGYTPLHELVVDWCRGPKLYHPKDLALLLISKGADVNARDKKGIRPLGYAVGEERADIAQLLKEHGAKM